MATRDEILNKHFAAAMAEIQAEESKTASQRQAEQIRVKMDSLTQELQTLQRDPGPANQARRAELVAAITQHEGQLRALGAAPAAEDPSARVHVLGS
jgi:hypothetical protein